MAVCDNSPIAVPDAPPDEPPEEPGAMAKTPELRVQSG